MSVLNLKPALKREIILFMFSLYLFNMKLVLNNIWSFTLFLGISRFDGTERYDF